MSMPATEAVSSGLLGPVGTSSTDGSANEADKEMFLQLLVAQMRYQDPLNPTDSGQFLAQSAQFTALEKMQEVADQTAALLAAQVSFGASGLVGREITWTTPEGSERTGIVDSVSFGPEGPVLKADGSDITLASVQSVSA